jgi:hypothetical protein
VRVWLQVLPAIQEEHHPGFLLEIHGGVHRQEMGMSYDFKGKSWKNWASNPGNSWDMNGDLPQKHSGDFCFVGTSTYTQAIAGLITPLLSPASGSCYIMFKLSDIIRHPQRKFMEIGITLWHMFVENHESRDFPIYRHSHIDHIQH